MMEKSLRDLGGFLGYLAIGTLILVWLVGWLGVCLLVGQFFDLPEKTTAVTGAVLGPLGVVAVIYVGLASQSRSSNEVKKLISTDGSDYRNSQDPFS
jgi:Kef-type K+ transport system membrane component KefB